MFTLYINKFHNILTAIPQEDGRLQALVQRDVDWALWIADPLPNVDKNKETLNQNKIKINRYEGGKKISFNKNFTTVIQPHLVVNLF